MKKLYFLFLFPFFQLNAQQYYDTVNYNSISTIVSNYGTHFQDFGQNTSAFEAPTGSDNHLFYQAKFLFAGKDANGTFYINQGGSPTLGRDLFPGPHGNSGGLGGAPSLYSLCQTEIDNYLLWWECENGISSEGCNNVFSPSNETLNAIFNWPAHGDISQGEAYYLAPFYDNPNGKNGLDGNYNPNDGDIPIISGCCQTYLIQNDVDNTHTFTGTTAQGIEVHSKFHTFYGSNFLDSTLFIETTVINRGTKSFVEYYQTIYLDGRIGDVSDDYFGCDSAKAMVYYYNKDNDDEQSYGTNPPAVAVYSLYDPFTSAVVKLGFNPNDIESLYNSISGYRVDGISFVNPLGFPSQYMFNGNPMTNSGWVQSSSVGDKRLFASISIENFNPGDSIRQMYAISYAMGGNHLQNVQKLIDLADELHIFYGTEENKGCNESILGIDDTSESEFLIYPNPSSGQFTIAGNLNEISELRVLNVQGMEVFQTKDVKQMQSFTLNNSGIYLIELINQRSKIVKKIVVE